MTSVAFDELIFWIKLIFMHYQNETGKIQACIICFVSKSV